MKDNCVSIDEFWDVVRALAGDASRCLKEMDEVDEQDAAGQSFWHRMYARAVFGLIEGATLRRKWKSILKMLTRWCTVVSGLLNVWLP